MRGIILNLLAIICFTTANSSDTLYAQVPAKPAWEYVTLSYGPHGEKDEVYYDTKNVKRTPEGFTQVRLKYLGVHGNEQEKQKRLEALKRNRDAFGLPLQDYDRFAYSVMVIEFDCKKKLRRYPCFMDYDGSDKRIGTGCTEELPWEEIPDASIAKKVFDAVCGANKQ